MAGPRRKAGRAATCYPDARRPGTWAGSPPACQQVDSVAECPAGAVEDRPQRHRQADQEQHDDQRAERSVRVAEIEQGAGDQGADEIDAAEHAEPDPAGPGAEPEAVIADVVTEARQRGADVIGHARRSLRPGQARVRQDVQLLEDVEPPGSPASCITRATACRSLSASGRSGGRGGPPLYPIRSSAAFRPDRPECRHDFLVERREPVLRLAGSLPVALPEVAHHGGTQRGRDQPHRDDPAGGAQLERGVEQRTVARRTRRHSPPHASCSPPSA